jgi:hypothetical protein
MNICISGGLDDPSLVLWRRAIQRGMLTKLPRPGFWADLLRPSLEKGPEIFAAFRATDQLPVMRRPKVIMDQLRPPFPADRIGDTRPTSLIRDVPLEIISDMFL